jgi:hypothetical protein
MKAIETTLRHGGFELLQVHREGQVAVYAQFKPDRPKRIISYEVVRIKVRPARTLFGTEYPESEAYPSLSEWGRHGFTCASLERAMTKAKEMAQFDREGQEQVDSDDRRVPL